MTFLLFATIILAVVLMVLAISKLKMHPFIVMIVIALLVGLFWGVVDPESGLNPTGVVNQVKSGFGSIMTSIGIVAMRIISSSFLLAAIGITLSTVFQAVGKGTYSMIMSICRQLVILLPAAWLIARLTDNVYAVWWCFPIAELAALFICIFYYRSCDRNMISKLEPAGETA